MRNMHKHTRGDTIHTLAEPDRRVLGRREEQFDNLSGEQEFVRCIIFVVQVVE